MAVPKKRVSKSRKGMRRSHDHVTLATVITCECGAPSVPHAACPTCGKYRGRQITKPASLVDGASA